MVTIDQRELMSEVDSFNHDYDRNGVNKLKEGLQSIIKCCERGLKCHWNVMGYGRCFYVLTDKTSREWYSDNQNWSYVTHGTIMLLNLFKRNCDIINQVLKVMIIVDGEGYDHNFSYYDKDCITGCESFEEYLCKYGCSLFDHKRTNQPKKVIVVIFEKIMKDHVKGNWLRCVWEFRFFSIIKPIRNKFWKLFVSWASVANDKIRNISHVYQPMVRFTRRILFSPHNQLSTRLKGRNIYISYLNQHVYNRSINHAVDYLYGIGKKQDEGKMVKQEHLSCLEEKQENQSPKKKNVTRKYSRNKPKIRSKRKEVKENEYQGSNDDESHLDDICDSNHETVLKQGNDGDLDARQTNDDKNHNSNPTRGQKRKRSEMVDDESVLSAVCLRSDGKFANVMFNGNKRRKLTHSSQSVTSQYYIKDTFYNPRLPQEKKVSATSSVCCT